MLQNTILYNIYLVNKNLINRPYDIVNKNIDRSILIINYYFGNLNI